MKMNCPFCDTVTDLSMPLEMPLPDFLDQIEKVIVEAALKRTYNNRTSAAKDLGMPVYAVRHLIKKHGLNNKE